jgi:IPT/TIG domain
MTGQLLDGSCRRIKIIGTDLQCDASVTFGNAKVFSNSCDPRDAPNTSLLITTPAHAAGVVDVIVANPNGQAVRASAGYEFAEPQSFDFNGSWSGVTADGTDPLLEFVVQNNVLVSASCVGVTKTAVQLSTDVIDGAFLAETPDGFRLSGQIVSGSQSIGRMSAPGCIGDSVWQASKVPVSDDIGVDFSISVSADEAAESRLRAMTDSSRSCE